MQTLPTTSNTLQSTSFELDRKMLVRRLEQLKHFIAKKPVQAIMTCVKLTVSGNNLYLSGSDLDNWMVLNMPIVNRASDGVVCVNHRELLDLVKKMTGTRVTLAAGISDKLVIGDGNMSITLRTSPADDYPHAPQVNDAAGILTAEVLASIFSKHVQFAANYDDRSILGGVNFNGDGNTIKLCATDDSRMSADTLPSLITINRIVPAAALAKLQKILKSAVQFEVFTDSQNIRLASDNVDLIIRTINGQYPKYQELFPVEYKSIVTFDKQALLSVVKMAEKSADERTHLVKIEFSDKCTLKTSVPDGPSFETSLSYGWTSDKPEMFAVNAHYLRQAVEAVDDDVVVLEYQAPLKPLVFRLSDTAKHLLMPVQAK